MSARWQQELSQYLPKDLRCALRALDETTAARVEELRIRASRPLMVAAGGEDIFVDAHGRSVGPKEALRIGAEHVGEIFERVTRASVYAVEHELQCGYTTLPGGYRVGFCGKTVIRLGVPTIISPCASFNIRIVREVIGCADPVLPFIVEGQRVHSTLVVSPPGVGKTTLLRDIARSLSTGFAGCGGFHVSVVDERSEIAACYGGVPQTQLGPRVDVLDGCPKAEGMQMLVRAMAPDVLVVDELARPEELEAVRDAAGGGVAVIASAHGDTVDQVLRRPAFAGCAGQDVFTRCVVLWRAGGVGSIRGVFALPGMRMLYSPPHEEGGRVCCG
ncbi:MAG: stage III sporulation protein AA [Clostridiales bacterium]|jgi:stage III sporulation protein AA|nr:stage III sporulation protein AA [Clostridiales bacterium]